MGFVHVNMDSDSPYSSNVKSLPSGSSSISTVQFSDEWMGKERIFFYVIFMKESAFIWIVALHSHTSPQPSLAEVFGNNPMASRLASHVTSKYHIVSFVSYNCNEGDDTLAAWAEKKLFSKLDEKLMKKKNNIP